MKRFTNYFLFAVLFVLFFMAAPVHAASAVGVHAVVITTEQVLQSILYVAGIFALLPGVALLVSSLTNTIKAIGNLFGFQFDGNSDQVTAWLNLIAFIGLIALRVFSPSVTFEWLDSQAKLAADALIALAFFFGQLRLQPVAHSILKGKLPLIGTSYSK